MTKRGLDVTGCGLFHRACNISALCACFAPRAASAADDSYQYML